VHCVLGLCSGTVHVFNRRSRIVQWIGVVDGQNTSCKAHKVCISLWPLGRDDVRTRANQVAIVNWKVKRFGGRFASTVLWYNFVLTSKHL